MVSLGFSGPDRSTENLTFQNSDEKATCIPKLTWMWKPSQVSPTATSSFTDLKLQLNQYHDGSTQQRTPPTGVRSTNEHAAAYPRRRATVAPFQNDKTNSPRELTRMQPSVVPRLATPAQQQENQQLGSKCLRFSKDEDFKMKRTKQSFYHEFKPLGHPLLGRPTQRLSVLSQSTIETAASLSQNDPRRTGISAATLKRQAARLKQEYKKTKPVNSTVLRSAHTSLSKGYESRTMNARPTDHRHGSLITTASPCAHPQFPETADDSGIVTDKTALILQGRRGSMYSDAHTSFWDGRRTESLPSSDTSAGYTPEFEASRDDVSMSTADATSVRQKLDEISKLETAIANQKTGLETSVGARSILDIIAGEANDWYPRLRPIVKKMIYGRIDEPIRLASLIEQALTRH